MTACIGILSAFTALLVAGKLAGRLPSVRAAERYFSARRTEEGDRWEWQSLLARSGNKVAALLRHPVRCRAAASALCRAAAGSEEEIREETARRAGERYDDVRAALSRVPVPFRAPSSVLSRAEKETRRAGYFSNGTFSALFFGDRMFAAAFGERDCIEWTSPGKEFLATGFRGNAVTLVFRGAGGKTVARLTPAAEGAGLIGTVEGGELRARGTGRIAAFPVCAADGSVRIGFAPAGTVPRGPLPMTPAKGHPLRDLDAYQRERARTEREFYALAAHLASSAPVALTRLDLDPANLVTPVGGNPLRTEYRVIRTDEAGAVRAAQLLAPLAVFFPVLLAVRPSADGENALRAALKNKCRFPRGVAVFAGTGAEKIAPQAIFRPKRAATEFEFRLPAAGLGEAIKRMEEDKRAEIAGDGGDVEILLLDSLTCSRAAAREALVRAASLQLLDGRFVSDCRGRLGYLDKNAFTFLFYPIAAAAYLERTGDRSILSERARYASFARSRGGAYAEFGRVARTFPEDSVYEHILKCFETGEFRESGLVTRRKSTFLGLLGEPYRRKNAIFALLYCTALTRFLPYFEGERMKARYIRLLASLRARLGRFFDPRGTEGKMSEEEKLLFAALGETAFTGRAATLPAEYADLLDFFECFARGGAVRRLPLERVYLGFKALILAGKKEAAQRMLSELFCLMRAAGETAMRAALCFDGERFYFAGEETPKLSALFLADVRLSLFGLRLSDDEISFRGASEALVGGELTARAAGGSIRLSFRKSEDGKPRIRMGGRGYSGVEALPVGALSGDREGTVEL